LLIESQRGINQAMTKIKLSNRVHVKSPRKVNTAKPSLETRPRNMQAKPASKPTANISVLIADDHTFIREALRSLLDGDQDIRVVGEADNGRKAMELALEMQPDVLLMDVGMPKLNGLEAARQIRKLAPNVRVILLTAFGYDQYIQQMVDADIHGYVIKDSPSNLLNHAIHEVMKGNRFFSPTISRRMKTIYDELPVSSDGSKAVKLTSREIEVLQLIAEGAANKQIAGELNISIKTVEKHRQNLMDKLRIHETASLTRYAISTGVIDNMVQTLLPL
jgi:DNA-binding NarL/FixJ family response regulator